MKKVLGFLCCLLAFSLNARPWFLLFGSADCMECMQFKENWQLAYSQPQDPALVFIDIDKPDNYALLGRLEDKLGIEEKAMSFPVILAGRQTFSGLQDLMAIEKAARTPLSNNTKDSLFQPIIQAVQASQAPIVAYDYQPAPAAPQKPAINTVAAKPAGSAVTVKPASSTDQAMTSEAMPQVSRLLFFQQPGCQKCARQSREFDLLRESLPALVIDAYDVTTVPGQAMLTRAKTFYGIQEDNATNLSPMVGWMKGYVTGRLATADELLQALATPPKTPEFWVTPLTEQELAQEENRLEDVIHALTWWSVIGGGLIDGINPCAFATSIFLISYLLYLKRRRRDIILVGASFCLGVFLAYFLYGFLAAHLLKGLQSIAWIKLPLYGAFALSGFVLAILHLRDAIRFRRTGKTKDMDMGLSHDTHRRIHDKIKRFSAIRTWLACPAAVILGAIVSTMELACTGQVYFPILTALAYREFDPTFFLLLFLYNLCFILPLVVITILAAFGVGAKALGDWARRHVFSTKVAMAILFALLAALMLAMALG